MGDKKLYEKPELKTLQPSEVIAELLRGQQAVIDSVSAIGSMLQGQAKEIKQLRTELEEAGVLKK